MPTKIAILVDNYRAKIVFSPSEAFFSVIEVTEDVLPNAWRQIMAADKRKMESENQLKLSSVYHACAGRK